MTGKFRTISEPVVFLECRLLYAAGGKKERENYFSYNDHVGRGLTSINNIRYVRSELLTQEPNEISVEQFKNQSECTHVVPVLTSHHILRVIEVPTVLIQSGAVWYDPKVWVVNRGLTEHYMKHRFDTDNS